MMKKSIPFILFVFGFLTLDLFQGLVSIACIVIGIMMFIELRWPEKWGEEEQNGTEE